MKRAVVILLLILGGVTSTTADDNTGVIADSAGADSCAPPVILNPPDTLYGDSLNFVEYQFLADPGGVNGNGEIHWEMVWGYGEVDSLSGLFSAGPFPHVWMYPASICVVNDCASPPNADT